MYTRVSIEGFRSLEGLVLDDLRRVNLLVGKNNTGKTSVLEALFLLGGAPNPALPRTIGELRGQRLPSGAHPDPLLRSLFPRFSRHRAISIAARWGGEAGDRRLVVNGLVSPWAEAPAEALQQEGVARAHDEETIVTLVFSYENGDGRELQVVAEPGAAGTAKRRDDFVRTSFISARGAPTLERDTEQYSQLLRVKRERGVLDALRIVEPSLRSLEVLAEGGTTALYADVGLPALAPLLVCGEGLVRLFSIVVELTATRSGVLLIDEIDNGLHHSVMEPFWRSLITTAIESDVQIFATTHNDEIIRAIGEEHVPEVSLLRLDRAGEKVHVARYADEVLRAAIEEGFEVRG